MKNRSKSTLYLARGGLVAAMYVALTYLSFLLGISSGVIQFRMSEMLCILPVFFPEAILGITVGCIISNLITGAVVWDIIFGSLATLIGAFGARFLRNLPEKLKFVATLPTLFANALIIPLVLLFAYGIEGGYWYFFLTVGIGELVCATIGGTFLYSSLKKIDLNIK